MSALWGKGGRGMTVLTTLVALALAVPAAGLSAGGQGQGLGQADAFVPASLLSAAQASPDRVFHVIVQGTKGHSSQDVAGDVGAVSAKAKRVFRSISGVSADISGTQLLKLAKRPYVSAITPDIPMHPSTYQNGEMWRDSANLTPLFGTATSPAPATPAIAIVDSGIDAARAADFGARVVASVNLSSLAPGATGDQEGHGTLVAGIAAGSSPTYQGAAPNAPLVDVRTADASGKSVESDVVAAADWILQHKAQYSIGVANFSMQGATDVSFQNDPLDKAVEKLWLNGVVVVTAAGNKGTGTGPVDVSLVPGNDPFVIDVGAVDQNQTASTLDDTLPTWSSYGTTRDGFARPDVSAPGRYLIGPVSLGTTIATQVPDRQVAPGYFWMSGTSLAAPVVSGAAAQILARNPSWTPDQVKGALMATAHALPGVSGFAAGVGEIDAAAAAAKVNPPNPNENLLPFVSTDVTTGLRSFDVAAWESYVTANRGWQQANWSAVSWSSVSWSEVSWSSVSWSEVSWSSTATSAVSWSEVSWSEVSWTEVSWAE